MLSCVRVADIMLDSLRSVSKDVFNTYVCQSSVNCGLPHPGDIAESTSLRWIPMPLMDCLA